MKNLVYLSLGSNVGDCFSNLKITIQRLTENPEIDQIKVSGVYLTSPVDYLNQDDFYNLALSFSTEQPIHEFHRSLKLIEEQVSREVDLPHKMVDKGPRVIDIDIILYGKHIIDEPRLKIPHPSYLDRLFVLKPLLELDKDIVDPQTGVRLQQHLLQGDFEGQEIFKLKEHL